MSAFHPLQTLGPPLYLLAVIDFFRTWLPQIIGYAEMLQDDTLEKAWSEGDRSRTSIYYSGELYEQIFGDLHADEMMEEARLRLGQHPSLVAALDRFLGALKQLDNWIEAHVDTATWGKGERIPSGVRSIFQSPEWLGAQSNAADLVSASGLAGFSSEDFDPTP